MISTTVPFRIPNVFQGLVLTEGILSVEGADLKLEFQTAYVLGLLKSGVREVRLPLDKIEEIRFVKTWLGRTVVVRVAEMRGAAEVPNSSGGEILLSIDKWHSQAASDLVSSIQIAIGSQANK